MSNVECEITRREVLGRVSAVAAGLIAPTLLAEEASKELTTHIFDSHVHLWDLKQFHLPWLESSQPALRRDFSMADYRSATASLGVVAATYVEVNVEPGQQEREAEYVVDLCRRPDSPISAGVIAGDPREPGFKNYIESFQDRQGIRGVRCLYPMDGAADRDFIEGLRWLGERRLSFELQLGPPFLADAAKTAAACPQTVFVLNHCGGVEPRIFRSGQNSAEDRQRRENWRRDMAAIARRDNVVCKISGVVDTALPGDATADDVAPIIHFCLEQFGSDRVLFGGNWPVCLKGSTLKHWIESLRRVVADRPAEEHRKLFHDNAVRIYRIEKLSKGA